MSHRLVMLLVVVALFISGCQGGSVPERAARGQTITSPSGRFVLVVTQPDPGQPDMLGFQLEDAAHHVVFTPPERWSDRHRLHFVWDAADRAWCYSSDVGIDVWERQPDGTWQRKDWLNTGLATEPALPETLRPFLPRSQAPSR